MDKFASLLADKFSSRHKI